MSLVKRTYVDQETVITAENLNAIQDAIIENEEAIENQGDDIGNLQDAVGDGALDPDFTATNLTGAANELKNDVSDVRNTLSHKADVIYDTASGDIASFPDGADGLPVKDLTVAIEPVQAGTGDPSPDNVRPISGWTGAKIAHNSGNLLNLNSTPELSDGVTITVLEDGFRASCTSVRNWRQIRFPITIPIDGIYTMSATVNIVSGSNPYADCGFTPEVASEMIKRSGNIRTNGNIYYTRRMTAGTYYATYWVSGGTASENVIEYHNVKAELGMPSDPYVPTPFVPYNGNDLIPISWQSEAGTVYGGTLDVTSGVLTVDRAMVDLGTLNWGYVPEQNFFTVAPTGIKTPHAYDEVITSCYASYAGKSDADMATAQTGIYVGSNGKLKLKDTRYSSLLDLKSALSGQSAVYPLAQPTSVTLTPTEIETLLGQNNIWADCGPSTVEYPCDTKRYIQKINAPTDDDMIADAQIASGKYFIVGNNLYLSTTTILAGDPIKPGTNCTLTNLAAALNALNS